MEVEATGKDTHQRRERSREKCNVRLVFGRRHRLLPGHIVIVSRFVRSVLGVRERVDPHSDREYDDEHDEDDAEGVNLVVYRGVLRRDHAEDHSEDYYARVRVAELRPVGVVSDGTFLTSSQANEIQDDWVQVLSKELEEENDWNGEVDDKTDHSGNITFLSKLLPQRISIIDVISSCFHHQEARIEREHEGHEGQHDSKNDTALFIGPRNNCKCCACHAIPSAKDCHKRAMFALLINYY